MGTINDYQAFMAQFEGYRISDQDVDSSDSDITYYGYNNREGDWYIMQYDKSVSGDVDVKSWRFVKGTASDDYATQWAARESQSYQLLETAFN